MTLWIHALKEPNITRRNVPNGFLTTREFGVSSKLETDALINFVYFETHFANRALFTWPINEPSIKSNRISFVRLSR